MNKKETISTASREQLNRFIDDLRKELVLGRMQLAESGRQSKDFLERLKKSEKSAEALRMSLHEQELLHEDLKKEFQRHLMLKDAQISQLRTMLENNDAKVEEVQINSNENELVLLRQANEELESLNKSLVFEMQSQLNQNHEQMVKLKSFIARKELALQKATEEFERQIKDRDEHIKDLNELVRRNASDVLASEKYKGLLKITEETSVQVAEENRILKKELSDARKVIDLRDSLLKEEAKRFEDFSSEISRKADERIKELISDFSERDIKLKIELEHAKSKLMEQQLTVVAKEKEIDIALGNFATVTQNILSFRTPDSITAYKEKELIDVQKAIEQKNQQLSIKELELKGVLDDIALREKKLSERENQLSMLLRKAEEKAEIVMSSEDEIRKKEDLLIMQQTAFQKQMAMVEELGYEFKEKALEKPVEYQLEKPVELERPEPAPIELKELPVPKLAPVKSKIAQVKPQKIKQASPVIINLSKQPRILKILKHKQILHPIQVQAPSPPEKMHKIVPSQKDEKPAVVHNESREAMFGKEREGFPELDEIISIVEIARAHGEVDDKIKVSLVNSGYDKEKIALAMARVSQ